MGEDLTIDINKVRQRISAGDDHDGLFDLNPLEDAVVTAFSSPHERAPRDESQVEWVELPQEHEARAKAVALRLMQDFFGAYAE